MRWGRIAWRYERENAVAHEEVAASVPQDRKEVAAEEGEEGEESAQRAPAQPRRAPGRSAQ